MGADDPFEFFGIGVDHASAAAADAGIVDQNVDEPEVAEDCVGQLFTLVEGTHRGRIGHRSAAHLLHLGHRFCRRIGVLAVVDGDVGSVFSQGQRDGLADAASPTGYESYSSS